MQVSCWSTYDFTLSRQVIFWEEVHAVLMEGLMSGAVVLTLSLGQKTTHPATLLSITSLCLHSCFSSGRTQFKHL